MRIAAFLCLFLLAACGAWPDAGGPPMARSAQDWPELLPIDQVLGSGQLAAAGDDDAEALRRRADALRGRAAILRSDATDLEELRTRLTR